MNPKNDKPRKKCFQVLDARKSLSEEHRKPILLKLSPDLTQQDMRDIADVLSKADVRSSLKHIYKKS